jgi:NAD(P)-dependent dehydrogenase (short-subunit alcohol dehydrogenase family)
MQRAVSTPFLPGPPTRRARALLAPLNPSFDDWSGRRVWIVGASSGIGAELARALQHRGARIALSARRADALREVAGCVEGPRPDGPSEPAPRPAPPHGGRAAPAEILPLDVNDADAIADACRTLRERWGGIDLVLWVAGTYTPMRAADFDLAAARRMLDTNLGSVFGGLAALLPMLLEQRSGGIALVSSVAGYSGLPQALVYGPTKAALINLAESLYVDLHPSGIGVYLVNPGYVDTPATAANGYRMPALISAAQAAAATLDGIAAGRFEVHYPRRFTTWLKVARLLPYRAYFTLVRRVTGA